MVDKWKGGCWVLRNMLSVEKQWVNIEIIGIADDVAG